MDSGEILKAILAVGSSIATAVSTWMAQKARKRPRRKQGAEDLLFRLTVTSLILVLVTIGYFLHDSSLAREREAHSFVVSVIGDVGDYFVAAEEEIEKDGLWTQGSGASRDETLASIEIHRANLMKTMDASRALAYKAIKVFKEDESTLNPIVDVCHEFSSGVIADMTPEKIGNEDLSRVKSKILAEIRNCRIKVAEELRKCKLSAYAK